MYQVLPTEPLHYMRGALGFSVLRFWVFFRSVLRFLLQKTSVFLFWWSLRFADFSFFSIWFSVLVPDVVFGFPYFVLFWVPVSVRFEQHLISNSRETPKLFRGMRDKINVMVGDQASPLTPGETLTSQTRATIWSVCELWLPTCLPRQQRKKQLWIVLRFFTRRGKAARIFERKTSLDVKWKGKREACRSLRIVFGKSIDNH